MDTRSSLRCSVWSSKHGAIREMYQRPPGADVVTEEDVRTRSIGGDDLAGCAEVYAEVYNGAPWKERWTHGDALARLQAIEDTPGFHGTLAVEDDGDDVLGFALGHTQPWFGGRKHFYIREVCVEAHHQRCGIGTAIMQRMLRELVPMGVEKAYLLTSRDSPSEDFYRKCGFTVSPNMVMMGKYLSDVH